MSVATPSGNLAFIGLDAARFLGWLPAHESAVLVVRDTMGLKLSQPVLECPAEEQDGGTLALLQDPRVLPFLRENGVSTIIVFKPTFRVQQWIEAQGMTLLAGDCALAQRLENKIQFAQIALEENVPIPPCEVFKKGLPPWEEVSTRFRVPFVLQKARGHSGQGTFLVNDQSEWEGHLAASKGRGLWKVSQVVAGETWTLNGVMTRTGNVVLGGLYEQRTGDQRCTVSPLGACGNRWTQASPEPRLTQAVDACVSLLRHQEYSGAFGVDILLPDDGSSALVIEVNARSTSGLSMEAMLSRHLGEKSLVDYLLQNSDIQDSRTELSGAITAIQAVLYGENQEPVQLLKTLSSGTYRWDEEMKEPQIVSKETNPTYCNGREAVILARSAGQWIGPQGERARIQLMGDEETLKSWIEWVYGRLQP